MLFAAGSLSNKASGTPIWPELPSEILVANPAFLDDNAEKTKGWYPSSPAEQKCRTIFLVQKRTVRVPLLEAFDLPTIMGVVVFSTLAIIVFNVIVDVLYASIDPRIRLE